MTYEIEQIANAQRCNSFVSQLCFQKAAASYVAEQWADGHALFDAIKSGAIDYDSETDNFNEALQAAGVPFAIEADEVETALRDWAESQK